MTRTDAMVVIPWRPQPHRLPAFEYVTAWYRDAGFEVLPVDASSWPRFNLAASRNLGVTLATTPVVVISDADTFPELAALDEAIAAAAASGRTHLPYEEGGYRILGDRGTRQLLTEGRPPIDCDHVSFPWSCSGVFVTTPTAWATHYGHDERFTGWAPEDFAWRLTHETLLGPVPRHPGRVYALTHDTAEKTYGTTGPGADRWRAYEAATGDPDAIRALASEYLTD